MNPNKHIRALRAAVALTAAQSLIMIPTAHASCWECDAQYDEDMSNCNNAYDSATAACAELPDPSECNWNASWAFYECAAGAGSGCTCC